MDIRGKRVLITGASRGIGRDLALPRRMALSSFLVDAPRRLTWAAAHGLTTPPVPAAAAAERVGR